MQLDHWALTVCLSARVSRQGMFSAATGWPMDSTFCGVLMDRGKSVELIT